MRLRTRELAQMLGIAGAIVAWLGWFEIAPALGFPTIGPVAMLNRVFLPDSDPDVWLGWVVVAIGLTAAAALYMLITARGWVQPGVLSGLLFGLAAWLIAGTVLMVIIGHISPPPPALPPPPGPPLPTTPDPMHATFMMLHLGALAPVDALAAWLLFGAVVGATFASVQAIGATRTAGFGRIPATLFAGGVVALVVVLVARIWVADWWTSSALTRQAQSVESRTLAAGPAEALPPGPVFVSVIELRQTPGATLGPHAHVPGFAYVLRGAETISFPDQPSIELGAGDSGFMSALGIHSHKNPNRAPAIVLAVALLAIVITLSRISLGRIATRHVVMAALGGLLTVAGAVALWDPWANDWYFIGVRPAAARGGVMPIPDASRVLESSNLTNGSGGPFMETLRLVTVPPGGRSTIEQEPGPEAFVVVSGQGTIRVDGNAPLSLQTFDGGLAQEGATVRISNPGDDAVSLLGFSVVASGKGG